MTRWKMTFAALAISTAAFAQKPDPAPATTATTAVVTTNRTVSASETREDLRSILRDHAPQLATVIKLDPTLLTNQAYLATYPDLNTFLTQHPEVAHNPGYYFEGVGSSGADSGFRAWRDVMGDVAGFTVFLVITGVLIWMIRTIIEQRRWNRLSAIQTEVHSKLMDRFTSNEELLAYLQTPAGKKFLEAAPIPLEAGPKPMSAPVGRIFWSLQAGLVLIAAGIGFDLVSLRVPNPDSTGLYGVGVIALLMGIALVLSAIVFYGLSRRFGLFQPDVASSE